MPRSRYQRGTRRYGRQLSGRDYALRHIEEARQLSAELGGSDQDVKDFFFSLPRQRLAPILNEYEARHGSAAREYAEDTFPKWRNGTVKMGGMVASRLFALLPPHMPISEKHKVAEKLWKHVGPRSHKVIRIGADASVDDVIDTVRAHISDVVISYEIPQSLEQRFDWLSAGDVHVKQQILNHLRQAETELVVEAARQHVPVMLRHVLGPDGNRTSRYVESLRIGNHELEMFVDPNATGVQLENAEAHPGVPRSNDSDWGWLWWVIGAGVVIALIARVQQ